MLVGTLAVTAIYLLVNVAFLHALGLEGTRHTTAPAAEVLDVGHRTVGRAAISLLICISALGAINGQIFTGARIYSDGEPINGMIFTGAKMYYAMGTEHDCTPGWVDGTPAAARRSARCWCKGRSPLVLAVWFGLNGKKRIREHGECSPRRAFGSS